MMKASGFSRNKAAKHFKSRTYLLVLLISVCTSTFAQNNIWQTIDKVQGVSVSWRWRKELKDQNVAELKFENGNNFKVSVSYAPRFICADGTDWVGPETKIYIAANAKKTGQDGIQHYPCKGALPPSQGGFVRLIVKRGEIPLSKLAKNSITTPKKMEEVGSDKIESKSGVLQNQPTSQAKKSISNNTTPVVAEPEVIDYSGYFEVTTESPTIGDFLQSLEIVKSGSEYSGKYQEYWRFYQHGYTYDINILQIKPDGTFTFEIDRKAFNYRDVVSIPAGRNVFEGRFTGDLKHINLSRLQGEIVNMTKR